MKQEEKNPYAERNRSLETLGFRSYEAYLESGLWKRIRDRKLSSAPACGRCGKKARQLHHGSYDLATMSGESLDALIPACDKCHRHVELAVAERRLAAADRIATVTLLLLTRDPARGRRQGKRRLGMRVTWRPEAVLPWNIKETSQHQRKRESLNRRAATNQPTDMAPRLVKGRQQRGNGLG